MTYRRAVRTETGRGEDANVFMGATVDEDTVETFSESDAAESVGTTWISDSVPGRVAAILTALTLTLESLLTLRFVLRAFGANPASGFVDFVMDVSWPFVRPFRGAFANRTWDQGILEINTLLAMGIWLLAVVLIGLALNAALPNAKSSETTVRRRRVSHM